MKKGVFGLAALAVSWVWAFPSAVTYVNEGETVSFAASTNLTSKVTDSGSNKYGSFVYSQGSGGTLKVTVPAGAQQAVMWSALFVTNGVLTLDLTDVVAAGIPYYQHGGVITRYPDAKGAMCEGTLVVKGMDNLLLGDPQNNYERYEITQIGFQDAAGAPLATGSVTFTNTFNFVAVPPCPWSIAAKGVKTIGLLEPRGLDSFIQDGVFDVPSSCNQLSLLCNDAIDPAATIRVPAGKTLYTYYTHYGTTLSTTPNTVTQGAEGFFWSMNGNGADEHVVPNAVELAQGGVLRLGLRVTTFEGPVTGAGAVEVKAAGNNDYCRAWFRKPVAVSSVVLQPSSAHATVPFDLSFFDTVAADLQLAATNAVASFVSATSTIGTVAGYAENLPAGDEAKYPAVHAKDGACVKIGAATGRFRLVTSNGGTIEYGGFVYSHPDPVGALVVDGEVVALPSGFRLEVPSGSTMDLSALPGAMVKVDGAAKVAFSFWRAPALWLDASAAGSVSNLVLDAEVTGNGGYTLAPGYDGTVPFEPTTGALATNGATYFYCERWNDCRADQTARYTYQDRHRGSDKGWWPQVYPVVVTNGLNGHSYLAMDGLLKTGGNRRLEINRSGSNMFRPKFACLVFGSQGGGGNAVLAGAAFGRGQPDDTAWSKVPLSAPLLTNEVFKTDCVWVDGEAVDPTDEGLLSGGWQIVSIRLDGATAVNGLGYWKNSSRDSGGQRYAEVVFFDDWPTDAQRVEVESYLAHKWGLEATYRGSVAARPLAAYGAGEVLVDGVTVSAAGVFNGRVVLTNGAAFVVSPELLPIPTADDVAQIAGRTAWFDPDQEGAVKYFADAGYASCVNVLYDRVLGTADGAYALASAKGRAPSVETRTAGFGITRTWLQYANVSPVEVGTNKGNALRVNTMPNAYKDTVTPIAGTRTVVMVTDSSQGGGSPFLDENIGGSKINRFSTKNNSVFSKDWTKPIWNSTAASAYFAESVGGATYLNGRAVDGATAGFTGGPEILTAVAGAPFGLSATGGYAYKEGPTAEEPHTDVGEILGEMLTFSTVLSDADRGKVEAYLAYKWFGYLPEGSVHGSAADVTVAGDGRVTAPSYAALPRFAPDFAGTAEIAAPLDLAVAVDAAGQATPAVALPKVVLSGTQKLKVTFSGGTPKGGVWHTVVSAAGGLADVAWTIDVPEGVVYEVTDTAVRIKPAAGFVLIFR